MKNKSILDSTKDIIREVQLGERFIMVDYKNTKNERDIIISNQFILEYIINFIVTRIKMFMYLAIDKDIPNKSNLKLHFRRNINDSNTAFIYSIHLKKGISTGVLSNSRVTTIKKLIDENIAINDSKVPSYIFSILGKNNHTLEKRGYNEVAIDIFKLMKSQIAILMDKVFHKSSVAGSSVDFLDFTNKYNIKTSSIEIPVNCIEQNF